MELAYWHENEKIYVSIANMCLDIDRSELLESMDQFRVDWVSILKTCIYKKEHMIREGQISIIL